MPQMPGLSGLKASGRPSDRNVRPYPGPSAMKSINQVMLSASGAARASGLSRFSRVRGMIRSFNSAAQ